MAADPSNYAPQFVGLFYYLLKEVLSSMYQTLYEIFVTHVFNGALTDAYQNLVCTQLSAACCVFMSVLPFMIVWKVIKLIMG